MYHCIGTNSLVVFEPIHTELGRVWARWFLFLPGCAEIPMVSNSRLRWRKTEGRREWVHEVWVGHTLVKGVKNTVGWDAKRWAYFCQSSNVRKGRETGAV